MNYDIENVIGFEALLTTMYACRKNVMWKNSVKHYVLNGIEETLKLEAQLKSNTYKARKPSTFTITHPKKREILSVPFRDRVYQRSLNDNAIYPQMVKSFIYDNGACQKHKGTDFSRGRLKCFMQRFFRKHKLNGYVLQCDIQGYYPNMRHDITKETFKKHLDNAIYQMTKKVLDEQYVGDIGYNPGSQMVQIAGISMLNGLDHFIKEVLGIKYYIRYMDDFILIHNDKEYLAYCKGKIQEYVKNIGFELHPNKTRIYPISKGINFLGFTFSLTESNKVLMLINRQNVKHEKRKLRKLVNLANKGILSKSKVDQCYLCWRNHISKGNSYLLLQSMDKYYKNLWSVIK